MRARVTETVLALNVARLDAAGMGPQGLQADPVSEEPRSSPWALIPP
jgi:hypothetical protein